jgi:hypothetical protein
MSKLDEYLRRSREQANIWAEEARVLQETVEGHSKEAQQRARMASEFLEAVRQLERKVYGVDKNGDSSPKG